jgi:hypothetical protein
MNRVSVKRAACVSLFACITRVFGYAVAHKGNEVLTIQLRNRCYLRRIANRSEVVGDNSWVLNTLVYKRESASFFGKNRVRMETCCHVLLLLSRSKRRWSLEINQRLKSVLALNAANVFAVVFSLGKSP